MAFSALQGAPRRPFFSLKSLSLSVFCFFNSGFLFVLLSFTAFLPVILVSIHDQICRMRSKRQRTDIASDETNGQPNGNSTVFIASPDINTDPERVKLA
jgi:hypothetical protein